MDNKKITDTLMNIHSTLNIVEVKGKQNLTYLVGCMNAIESLVQEILNENENKSE